MSQCMDDINPTGSDLKKDQCDVVADVIKALGHIAFIDMEYQGLGDGLAQPSITEGKLPEVVDAIASACTP
jgi:aspartate/tyrosine/aromatic aminotransferase